MAMIRWEPVREINSIQQEMNRLFNTFFDTPAAGASGPDQRGRRWIPAMDLVERADHFVLEVDLPGLTEADVKVELEDNVLTISGDRKQDEQRRADGYYRLERAFGSFSRSLTLPEGIDAEGVSASFENGVLEVRVPKPEERKPRRVAISVGGDAPTMIEGDEAPANGQTAVTA
ncbi:MAG: Hsp20/alpha crystallin family protein [Solirubrobacterales bacterium]|jgi:HSP20 family protein|nr:Hsp20/alpha crystallin family protein [Solirubrobacterales bacterium]